MQPLLDAFNTGNLGAAVMPLVWLLMAHFSTQIVSNAKDIIVSALKAWNDSIDQSQLMQNATLRAIDDKFFEKLEQAVEAMMPIADTLKTAASNGKLSPMDIDNLKQQAWTIFVDNLGVKDWEDFALHLIPGFSPKSTSKDMIED